jgi:hypothetical protein
VEAGTAALTEIEQGAPRACAGFDRVFQELRRSMGAQRWPGDRWMPLLSGSSRNLFALARASQFTRQGPPLRKFVQPARGADA